ncbi:MAG: hypothetical protein NXI10_15300 [bacterium]|nr:hypothetical protein [bacterium]
MLKIGWLFFIFSFIHHGHSFGQKELILEVFIEKGAQRHQFLYNNSFWEAPDSIQPSVHGYVLPSDSSMRIEPWQIEMFTLRISGEISPKEELKLSNLKSLSLAKLTGVQAIHINIEDFKGKVNIALHDWPQYKEWQFLHEVGLLEMYTFNVLAKDYSDVDMNLNALRIFDLYTLRIPMSVGSVLDGLPNLHTLHARGVLSAFTHSIYQLQHLYEVIDYDPVYSNTFETLHAERYFLFQCEGQLEKIKDPVTDLWGMHELFFLSRELRSEVDNGEFLILENDLPYITGKTIDNDTLLHGYKKDGLHVGVHTFKVRESFTKNDREKFHIDFSNPNPPKFEKDGWWKYYYLNGNVAIEGQLRNRKKIGDWKFYEESGVLRTIKSFDNDTLKRCITRFELHGDTCESRTYYVNPLECVQSFTNVDGTKFHYQNFGEISQDRMGIASNRFWIISPKSQQKVNYKRSSKDYESVFRENVVDLLYPEYIGKELPFNLK